MTVAKPVWRVGWRAVGKGGGKGSASRAMILSDGGGSEAAHVRKRW